MRVTIKIIYTLLTLLAFAGCKQDITKSEKYLEVMEIHDVAMAEMGNLHNSSKEIKALITEEISGADSSKYLDVLQDLDKAEDGMMEWMSEFKLPDDDKMAEVFLENELVKVEKVNKDIFDALRKAKKIKEQQ